MDNLFEGKTGERFRKALLFAAYVLGAFLLVQTISSAMGWRYIGAGVAPANTISVNGHGETDATPDIATFTFTVSSTKSTVEAAQSDAATKQSAAVAYLKAQGVAEKDIKTSNYSVYPQYEYRQAVCPQMMLPSGSGSTGVAYCPGGKQVLTGYQASQSTTVKVRDLAKAGDLLSGVGTKGATDISQLTFTFDDPTGVQAQARDKAIADARKKADSLASALGVSIVRAVSFNENTSGYPQPVMYSLGADVAAEKAAVAPSISPGQNKVSDDVTITYEIR